ncbi:hypothetical protein GCM10007939_17410 [Amylibacter marinus]|uniref:N-acetyltransferase domain-containing protein n=1 Tax=Amylibacter marinus TaxID=1475483 RepID=A0ABQ5VWI9_9RHOB|nr:GNAT family protein [Amylibacter marinus]GLQ35458.1 hypothetical protein GCM10007939_17410 [Amylibacter marinus]
MFNRKETDRYLHQTLETERLRLVICSKKVAQNLARHWQNSEDIRRNLMMNTQGYSNLQWQRKMKWPDRHSIFYHALVPKEIGKAVGLHQVILAESGTIDMAVVIHAQEWWGQDIYFEARQKIIQHFAQSDRVMRFSGKCLDRNFASIYNYKRLGFRSVGFVQKSYLDRKAQQHLGVCLFEKMADDVLSETGGGNGQA